MASCDGPFQPVRALRLPGGSGPSRHKVPEAGSVDLSLPIRLPASKTAGGEPMRKYSATLGDGGRSVALVTRLTREFVRPHAKRIAVAFLMMGVASASMALRAWLMQPVLDRIFVGREESLLLLIAGGALALALIKGLADYGNAVLMNRVGQRVIADVQKALFARLMRADLAYFHAHPTGALISRFTNDVVLLRGAAANVLGAIGRDAVTVVFLVGVMFYQDWFLALVSFFVFPLAHPSDRRHRPPDAARLRQHPGRDRSADDVVEPDFSRGPPRQGLRHGGV